MLGSHNSFSYLKPVKWWMRLINFAGKCQSLDVYDQILLQDVKFFDVRLKWDNKAQEFYLAHGIIRYSWNISPLVSFLDWLYTDELDDLISIGGKKFKCSYSPIFRFVLEYNNPIEDRTIIDKFKSLLDTLIFMYDGINILGGYTKWDEQCIYTGIGDKDVTLNHGYSSVLGWKRYFLIPWVYAWYYNRAHDTYIKYLVNKNKEVILLDFVDLLDTYYN